jgi:hypothetical protein
MGLLEVAVDPGKVMNRVWVSNGAGLLKEPVSLPVARSGLTPWRRCWPCTLASG